MANHDHQIRLVGAGFDAPPPPAGRVPTGGRYQPDRLAGEIPPDPVEHPSSGAEEDVDLWRAARRLVIAFVAIAGIAVLNFTVLRRFNADLPPVVLLGSFAVIMVATVISLTDGSSNTGSDEPAPSDDACAFGACPGPRPVGELSRRANSNANRLPGSGHGPGRGTRA